MCLVSTPLLSLFCRTYFLERPNLQFAFQQPQTTHPPTHPPARNTQRRRGASTYSTPQTPKKKTVNLDSRRPKNAKAVALPGYISNASVPAPREQIRRLSLNVVCTPSPQHHSTTDACSKDNVRPEQDSILTPSNAAPRSFVHYHNTIQTAVS